MLRDRMQNVLVMPPAVRRAFERALRQDVEPALAQGAPGERDALPGAPAWLREARAPG